MPIKATVTQGGPRARSDAIRNRTLLLKTADKLLAERGLGLTCHELAAAAGVGVGTVYRHFADKNALLGALIERRFEAARDLLLTAEKIEDPIDALREAITRMCKLQFTDRGLWQALLTDANRYGPLANEILVPISARIADRARQRTNSRRLLGDRLRDDLPVYRHPEPGDRTRAPRTVASICGRHSGRLHARLVRPPGSLGGRVDRNRDRRHHRGARQGQLTAGAVSVDKLRDGSLSRPYLVHIRVLVESIDRREGRTEVLVEILAAEVQLRDVGLGDAVRRGERLPVLGHLEECVRAHDEPSPGGVVHATGNCARAACSVS